MTTYQTVTLPERDDMLARLKGVMDEPHAGQYFYPKLLKHAGQTKMPEGIALMFVLAIADYTAGLPASLGIALDLMLPRWVAAIVDDEDMRAATLAVIAAAQQ
jgi:hypothetical protein